MSDVKFPWVCILLTRGTVLGHVEMARTFATRHEALKYAASIGGEWWAWIGQVRRPNKGEQEYALAQ